MAVPTNSVQQFFMSDQDCLDTAWGSVLDDEGLRKVRSTCQDGQCPRKLSWEHVRREPAGCLCRPWMADLTLLFNFSELMNESSFDVTIYYFFHLHVGHTSHYYYTLLYLHSLHVPVRPH